MGCFKENKVTEKRQSKLEAVAESLQRFSEYLEDQSGSSYLALRNYILDHEYYDPQARDFDDADKLIDAGKYREAIQVMEGNWPNYLLVPRAHLLVAAAYRKLGEKKMSDMEVIIAGRLLRDIARSGAGTEENPYRVTRVMSQYDLLRKLGERRSSQMTLSRNGRQYDVLTTASGRDIWFDITMRMKRLRAALAEKK